MTVAELLARCTSRELSEWQLLFEIKHDEEAWFHEHPKATYADYLDARDAKAEHERRIGRVDRTGDEEDLEPEDDELIEDEFI